MVVKCYRNFDTYSFILMNIEYQVEIVKMMYETCMYCIFFNIGLSYQIYKRKTYLDFMPRIKHGTAALEAHVL